MDYYELYKTALHKLDSLSEDELRAFTTPALVTRVEVIDHYSGKGRVFMHRHDDSQVELSYQDGGKTLKIFLSKKGGVS